MPFYLKTTRSNPTFLQVSVGKEHSFKTHKGQYTPCQDAEHQKYLIDLIFGKTTPCTELDFLHARRDYLNDELDEVGGLILHAMVKPAINNLISQSVENTLTLGEDGVTDNAA